MARTDIEAVVSYSPAFRRNTVALEILRAYVRFLRSACERAPPKLEAAYKESLLKAGSCAELRVALSVLTDLRAQKWTFRNRGDAVKLIRPPREPAQIDREVTREAHGVERDAQFASAAIRDFVQQLERRRRHKNGWVSIFSLMRDGRELAEALRSTRAIGDADLRVTKLKDAVDPYLQFVDSSGTCGITGFRLADIWRYFRYTWATTYQPVPGRNMSFLIRDRARETHPVVGIAALASPVVNLTVRDKWLGWHEDVFLGEFSSRTQDSQFKWVMEGLRRLKAAIYIDDLLTDGLLNNRILNEPTELDVASLIAEAKAVRALHKKLPMTRRLKHDPKEDDWLERAKTHLFRSKRCEALAEALQVRIHLADAGFDPSKPESVRQLVRSKGGRRALQMLRRQLKSENVGNQVMDISVCGAIAPYSYLLGGKLVAMMMLSPEVRNAYARRYRDQSSVIASSMAGRAIRRAPQMIALTTTSLYGIQPNQYTRAAVPTADSSYSVAFKSLGITEGQGSYHFSSRTIREMDRLLASRGESINRIFGEGVNPRMRIIRTALDMCGFSSDQLLWHGTPRVVYGATLATNAKDVLLGWSQSPRYALNGDASKETSRIANYWRERWLDKRIDRPEVLEQVEAESLTYPIVHRARVRMPAEDEQQLLFE
jgi:hypothetical protein